MMEKLGDRWHLRFGALKKYMKQYEKEPTPKEEFEGFKIGAWLVEQKQKLKRDKLPLERTKLLETLGIHPVDPMREHWERNYAAYKNYVTNAKKQPDRGTIHADIRIGIWLDYLRKIKRSLSKEQIQKLEAMGISWENHPSLQREKQIQRENRQVLLEADRLHQINKRVTKRWELFYKLCKEYLGLPGEKRTLTPNTVYKNRIIGAWFYEQNSESTKGQLSFDQQQRIRILKQISELRTHGTLPESNSGAVHEAQGATGEAWMKCYFLCQEFLSLPVDKGKLKRGTIYKNEPIGTWFEFQVGAYNQNRLSSENMARISILLHFSEERTRKINRENPL
jgi:hypothetical protein